MSLNKNEPTEVMSLNKSEPTEVMDLTRSELELTSIGSNTVEMEQPCVDKVKTEMDITLTTKMDTCNETLTTKMDTCSETLTTEMDTCSESLTTQMNTFEDETLTTEMNLTCYETLPTTDTFKEAKVEMVNVKVTPVLNGSDISDNNENKLSKYEKIFLKNKDGNCTMDIFKVNEIEYSGDISFGNLKPFIEDEKMIYFNKRTYYKRPWKCCLKTEFDLDVKIENIVRVDNSSIITSKFKIYKEKFLENCQKFKYTLSLEVSLNVDDVNLDKITKPCTKNYDITYWHLLVDDQFIFRVAFRQIEGRKDEALCNVECETQTITRNEFTVIFEKIKDQYKKQLQDESLEFLHPWIAEYSTLKVEVVTKDMASEIDLEVNGPEKALESLGNFFHLLVIYVL